MLVASLTNPEEIEQVGDLADLIELRLDHFADLSTLQRPRRPCLFTFRKKEQGGANNIPEADRLARLEQLLELQPDYCDIEADTDPAFIARIAQKFPHVKLIGSYHNFAETPLDLSSLLQKMSNPHFAVYKIAVTARSTADMLRLLIFASQAPVPLTAISMGEYGKPSRVLGPVVGNIFDYAGLHEEPHRYSLKTLHEIFHYRRLNRHTQIYGLIGDPIEPSIGHLFHNPRFSHNAVYVKMRLTPPELPAFFSLARRLPFGGLSVTMPLKEAILPHLDAIDPTAQAIGAVNTLSFRDGKILGTNTDGSGALDALEERTQVRGKRVAILGAGGSARAIAYTALQRGASVSLYNRTGERARNLAAELNCSGYDLDELSDYDILINTIPTDYVPRILSQSIIMDIANRPETPLLTAAKQAGCLCVHGKEMFVKQALLQQIAWIHP